MVLFLEIYICTHVCTKMAENKIENVSSNKSSPLHPRSVDKIIKPHFGFNQKKSEILNLKGALLVKYGFD